MPQSLFRFPRPRGESLRVRALAGHKVLVSEYDQEDLVALREGQRVRMCRNEFCISQEVRYAACAERDGQSFAFIHPDFPLRPLYLEDMREGEVVDVLAEA